MANWSSAHIELTGTEENILRAKGVIESHIEDGYIDPSLLAKNDSVAQRAGYGGGEIIDTIFGDTEIVLQIAGRWCAPHLYIEYLCERFSLSGYYSDEENGCNFFHLMEFIDGVKTKDIEDSFFSDLSIEHNGIERYLEEYEFITGQDDWENGYKEYIELFTKHGYPLEKLKEEWS